MKGALGHAIVSGRWDNNVAVIDIEAALRPENDGTSNAIISRPRVTPDVDVDGDGKPDAPASGQPVSLVVDPSARFAYVVNHSGASTPSAAGAYQHGHPGLVTVLDVARALDPANNGSLGAVDGFVPTGRTGPVGCALTPDARTLLISCAEAQESEDGGDEITAIDVATRAVVRRIPLAEAKGHGATEPSRHDSPHESFGRYPNPNGLAVSSVRGGLAFAGNGGTDDVSVIDLAAALKGRPDAEIARIPVEAGPFGLAASPDGRWIAVAARESMRERREGKTISLIDAELAASGRAAEVARVRVGSDDPNEETRPFAVAFTPDGKHVIASCFRSNSISIVSVADALAGRPAEVSRIYPKAPDGGPARPRGIAVAPDRTRALVVGGMKSGPGSSLIWVINLDKALVEATVTSVGDESYMLDVVSPLKGRQG
ncbi:MAG: YncE family protein [Beijerinckiaceae bacterium]